MFVSFRLENCMKKEVKSGIDLFGNRITLLITNEDKPNENDHTWKI